MGGAVFRYSLAPKKLIEIYLPPEMLEKVFVGLGPKDLLACRLLNLLWKSVAEKVLADRVTAELTKWNIRTGYNHVGLCIPSLIITSESPGFKHYSAILDICRHHSRNPFPSSSLRFVLEKHSLYKPEVEIDNFFKKFGHHLTHLILVDCQPSAKRFRDLLGYFPNLKSLTIEGLYMWYVNDKTYYNHDDVDADTDTDTDDTDDDKDGIDENKMELPKLSQLTHLRISSNRSNMGRGTQLSTHTLSWILKNYSSTLIGLTILGYEIIGPYECKSIKKCNWVELLQFKNLKQLKINFRNYGILNLLEGVSLSHMHIMSDEDANINGRCSPRNFCMNRLIGGHCARCCFWETKAGQTVQSIQPFGHSLVYLRISHEICMWKQSRQSIGFPNLTTLEITILKDYKETMPEMMTFLSALPSLKKLQFIHFEMNCEGIISVIKNGRYWKFCKNLEMMSVFNGRRDIGIETSNASRTIVIWKKSDKNKDDISYQEMLESVTGIVVILIIHMCVHIIQLIIVFYDFMMAVNKKE